MRMCLRQIQFVLLHFNRWYFSVCWGYKPSLSVLSPCVINITYCALQVTITGVHMRLCTQTGNDLVQVSEAGFFNTVVNTRVPNKVDKLHASSVTTDFPLWNCLSKCWRKIGLECFLTSKFTKQFSPYVGLLSCPSLLYVTSASRGPFIH